MFLRLSDSKVILILILALLVQILLLLWHMGYIVVGSPPPSSVDHEVAGRVAQVQNKLKRRPLDSLIWQPSRTDETVHFHDSVLTLGASQAKLELKNGTTINLGENTLITIEPPSKEFPEDIKIKFIGGNIKTRNPHHGSNISNDQFILKIKRGSEVDIQKSHDETFNVELSSGSAQLLKNQETLTIKEKERVNIDSEFSEKFKITETLSWIKDQKQRIYTHEKKGSLSLNWSGKATTLEILSQKHPRRKMAVSKDQERITLELPIGTHSLYLSDGELISARKVIEVRPAPVIHLIHPLPRDRFLPSKIEFSWVPNPLAQNYQLVIKGLNPQVKQQTSSHRLDIELNLESELDWEVWGLDSDNYLIPPLYDQKLYIRNNPFAPPKLHQPQKIPLNSGRKGAWLDWIIFSQARAATVWGALFSWDEIPGADLYQIEVSQSKDFRQLILNKKVATNQFIWKGIDPSQTYYWRVAAGDHSGRMGLFSPPQKVELVDVKNLIPPEKKKAPLKARPKPVPSSQPTQAKKLPQVSKHSSHSPIKSNPQQAKMQNDNQREETRWLRQMVFWKNLSYSINQIENTQNLTTRLSGAEILNFGIQADFNWRRQSIFHLILQFNSGEYEPDPKNQFPFQSNVTRTDAHLQMLWRSEKSGWLFGTHIGITPETLRLNEESMQLENQLYYGLSTGYHFQGENLEGFIILGPSLNTSGLGINLFHQLRYPFYHNFFAGAQLEVRAFEGAPRWSHSITGHLLLGYQLKW